MVEFGLIGKELFGDLAFGLPWRRVGGGANDDDTVIPTGVLTGVKARGVDGEIFDITKLLLPFAYRLRPLYAGFIADFREETDLRRTDRQGGRNDRYRLTRRAG